MNSYARLQQELEIVDRLLIKIDRVLDSAQPNLPGKIRIFFWHTHGQKKETEPVIVRRSKTKTKYPDKIQEKFLARRALSKGLFQRNHESTKSLLKLTSELLAYRKRIKDCITETENRTRGILNGNHGRTRDAEMSVIRLDRDVYARLEADGLEDYHQEIGEQIFKA